MWSKPLSTGAINVVNGMEKIARNEGMSISALMDEWHYALNPMIKRNSAQAIEDLFNEEFGPAWNTYHINFVYAVINNRE